MFAGLKLSNREDSEIKKKNALYSTLICTAHSECLELDEIFCTGACMYTCIIDLYLELYEKKKKIKKKKGKIIH